MSAQNHYVVKVVPYSSNWSLDFEREKKLLLAVLAPHIVTIEHTGSTSIPNQEAKPIIDMFAGVHSLLNESTYADLLSSSGYQYVETGMIERLLFAKESLGTRTHHLHILPIEGFYERNELLFRDYLRSHSDLVKEYGELKRLLAEQYHSDPEGYTRAKTAFIQHVVDLARTEKELPLQKVWE
ncbi:GrpB family protein [Paenibacillus sedimenti]|uniref:GrpB family protein n=1 Tax=Paenibacillus sedimenti TaxID=2770274 RepID=A0A926QM81_9BACL|nr:GrpB family protein [Paenibacillus sedimenti]MBD0384400.1 GrpB family protein [Paenibacillus sedimenti]